MSEKYHIAQLNIARMLKPKGHSQMADFFANIDRINALAESHDGFVWRLQEEETGNSMSIRAFSDQRLVVNMSVWESADHLFDYVYKTAHVEIMKRRKEWFEFMADSHLVLWWIEAGQIPTLDEAKTRLEHLREHGASEFAFTIKKRFPAPTES